MSQHVKTKRQANFKDFNRFGAFKGLVEQKNVVINSFVCKFGNKKNLTFPSNFFEKSFLFWKFSLSFSFKDLS
jgi:hypothetical protein